MRLGEGDSDLDFLPVLDAEFVFQSALHVQQAPPKDVQTLHSGTGKTNSETELEQAMTEIRYWLSGLKYRVA